MSAAPLVRSDADFLHRLWSDEVVAATLGGVRDRDVVERAITAAGEHWDRYSFGRWILWAGEERVGTVKLSYCEWTGTPEVELGYAIAPEFWGHGYASEAAAGALDFARTSTTLAEVIAVVAGDNPGSVSVLRRLQFVKEGVLDLAEGPHSLYRRQVR